MPDTSYTSGSTEPTDPFAAAFLAAFPGATVEVCDSEAPKAPSLESRTLNDPSPCLAPDVRWCDSLDIPATEGFSGIGYRVKVRRYASGDVEATAVFQERPICRSPRERVAKPTKTRADMSQDDVLRVEGRAKRAIREKVMQIQADTLITLTERGGSDFPTFSGFCQRFVSRFRKRYPRSLYVLVFEKHKKGNWHAHIATSGHFQFNSLRRSWHWAMTGEDRIRSGSDSPGNIDVKVPPRGRSWRPSGLARYVAKYVSKSLADGDLNRKRYWASRGIPPVEAQTFYIPVGFANEAELARLVCLVGGVARPQRFRVFSIGFVRGFYVATF